VSQIIKRHHECYKEKGYPDGLAGRKAPLGSRIVKVGDAYQATGSDRPYHKPFSREEVVVEHRYRHPYGRGAFIVHTTLALHLLFLSKNGRYRKFFPSPPLQVGNFH